MQGPPRSRLITLACAAAAGFATHPAFLALTSWIGLAAGLAPVALAPPAWDPGLVLIAIVLAPGIEELLHRGLVFGALRRTALGAAGAVLVSSASFALPHVEAWAVLGSFLVGLSLGGSRAAGASLPFCIALHAGLNASALLGAWRWASPLWLAVGAACWSLGLYRGWPLAGGPER